MAARVTAFVVIAIVAVTFVAGLIVGAQREDDSGPVDLIVYNARVYTGNPEAPFAEAIAIRGNRIWRVGSNRDIKRLMRRATTVIDAHGGTVTPGFRDGNVDLKAGGLSLVAASATATSATAASTTAAGAATAAGATTAAGGATTAASAAAGAVTAGAATSSATTSDLAAARPQVQTKTRPEVPSPAGATPQAETAAAGTETGDTLDAIQQAIGYANSVGVTSVGVTARTPDDLLPYDTLLRTRELTARVNAALTAEWPLDEAAVARLDALRRRYEGVPLFKLKAVKLAVTWKEPKDPPKPGKPLTDEQRLAATNAQVKVLSQSIALLEQHDWQVILEAQTSEDTGLALSAIRASSLPISPGSTVKRSSKRLVRVELNEGLQTSMPLADLNVMPATRKPAPEESPLVAAPAATAAEPAEQAEQTEPIDAATLAQRMKTYQKPMTAEELAMIALVSRPYARLMRHQPSFTLFSAWPVTALDPRVALKEILLDGLKLAANGTRDAMGLTERLSRAIDASTRFAAMGSGEADQQGTIKKEMLADLVIFSADLFALPPDKLMDAEVTTTIFDGKVIYTRPEPTADTSSQ